MGVACLTQSVLECRAPVNGLFTYCAGVNSITLGSSERGLLAYVLTCL